MGEFKLVVYRKYLDSETLGHAVILEDDKKLLKFNTLELPLFTVPLKENFVRTNCIPEGTYKVTKIFSPTKGACFMVHDVPGRTAILIHKGNYAAFFHVDTEGCILVGSKFSDINKDGYLDVIESTATLKAMLDILPNEFSLIIF